MSESWEGQMKERRSNKFECYCDTKEIKGKHEIIKQNFLRK
jgi:hypothetical protein